MSDCNRCYTQKLSELIYHVTHHGLLYPHEDNIYLLDDTLSLYLTSLAYQSTLSHEYLSLLPALLSLLKQTGNEYLRIICKILEQYILYRESSVQVSHTAHI